MKKALIVILILLILLLGGAWAYLLLNGAPKSIADLKENMFGTSGGSAVPAQGGMPAEIVPENAPSARTLNTTALLVKLTDRRVAGAILTPQSGGETVRYIEKGTGYIFEIPLLGGTETRLSNRTIPHVVEAKWSLDGTRVVLTTDLDGTRGESSLGTLAAGQLGTEVLDPLSNVTFSKDSTTLFYTEKNGARGTTAFARDLTTGTASTLFTLPFGESTVLWDIWNKKEHYAYTKPAQGFVGYLYHITPAALEKVGEGLSLTASRVDADTLLVNIHTGQGPRSALLAIESGQGSALTIETLSEKCVGVHTLLWCGASDAENANSFPVTWYQGLVSYADKLYRIDRTTGESAMITDPEAVSREQIDVTDLMAGEGGALIFKNKNDDSLWLYNPPQ